MTGVLTPCGSSMRASTLFESNREADSSVRDTYGLGGRPAWRDPCRVRGYLEIVCLAQGRVIFLASTFRREKMRCELCSGTSITAQSRCSSTSLPPLIAHKRPALPKQSRGRLGAQPQKPTEPQA